MWKTLGLQWRRPPATRVPLRRRRRSSRRAGSRCPGTLQRLCTSDRAGDRTEATSKYDRWNSERGSWLRGAGGRCGLEGGRETLRWAGLRWLFPPRERVAAASEVDPVTPILENQQNLGHFTSHSLTKSLQIRGYSEILCGMSIFNAIHTKFH